ncbi:thermoresistant gluconokinase family [Fusarium pseudocircinatum]|uniref:Gluconokinase n=1 Tax=Fusarium pseudocircinatum TaxID=56676 RepID=A0A8H5P5V1_9HYPO|nr:thermoresistant gluconokinase family [Fusarium pseudocircinatum]
MTVQWLPKKTIFVVGGPAGCGKSTVATYLSQQAAIPYLEGDDFHTPNNIAKMRNGTPLTDTDRWDWLIILRNAATEQLKKSSAVIVTCSSLRRKYRDVFRVASYHDHDVQLCFIFLRVDEAHLQARVKARVGHYMKESMVRSQMECLEEPALDEVDVVTIDVQRDPAVVCVDALDGVNTRLHRLEKV